MDKRLFAGADAINRAIEQIAEAIIKEFSPIETHGIVLVGLYKQGVPLAERIAAEIFRQSGAHLPVGTLDISMYRDDVGLKSALPLIRETKIPFAIDKQKVILVDDVLSSGRTIRAGLDAITDYGRPALIRLAVLVDRQSREYPIQADYVGMTHTFPSNRKVLVELAPEDPCDAIYDVTWIENKQS